MAELMCLSIFTSIISAKRTTTIINLLCAAILAVSCAGSKNTQPFSDKISTRGISSENVEEDMEKSFFPWIIDQHKIEIKSNKELNPSSIHLFDHNKTPIAIERIEDHTGGVTLYLNKKLDFTRNHYVIIDKEKIYALFSQKALNGFLNYQGNLGPIYDGKTLTIKVWSPTAIKVEAIFFDKTGSDQIVAKTELVRGDCGVWSVTKTNSELEQKDLHGMYYALKVTAFEKTMIALDPYAKSLAAFNPKKDEYAKAAIIDPKRVVLAGFNDDNYSNKTALPSLTSYIGYEMHVRDFTIHPSSDATNEERGTFSGVNYTIPYLKNLGITHVQLMPIQTFYTVNELDRSFQGDDIDKDEINYNWGYDVQHYFSPEGWYSVKPEDPSSRILELKNMVKNFHDNNIGVVMDVVYNHVYDMIKFEAIAPGCYLRRNDFGEVSLKSGAGASLETRIEMVRKLILDSILYFKNEFHIDGVRFDLMGFLDQDTLRKLHEKIGDDFILYGEAWEFTDLPENQAVTKSNLPKDIPVGAFNDSSRDAYTGQMSGEGFVQGAFNFAPQAKTGIVGGIKNYNTDYNNDGKNDVNISTDSYHRFANGPINTINYLTIHDGFTLWDKINLSVRGSEEERLRYAKMALSMLFTSQGRIVMHGGIERGRSKPLAPNDPNPDRAHTSKKVNPENGVTHFHENSYKSPDSTNSIDWSENKKTRVLPAYVKGLIQLRKSFAPFRYETGKQISSHLKFIAETVPTADIESNGISKHPHKDWSDIEELTIEFISGPINTTLFLVGEVHQSENKNPPINHYSLTLDNFGNGQITFTKEQINSFDLKNWSDPEGLQFKLVKTAGQWDSPPDSYTPTGNNTIRPKLLTEKNRATINLSVVNDTAGINEKPNNSYIAYSLESLSPEDKYARFICIHNGDDAAIEIAISGITCDNSDILVDKDSAGITSIEGSSVKIDNHKIYVPRKSSTVIGCK